MSSASSSRSSSPSPSPSPIWSSDSLSSPSLSDVSSSSPPKTDTSSSNNWPNSHLHAPDIPRSSLVPGLPEEGVEGSLYPGYEAEQDSCGVGFIASIRPFDPYTYVDPEDVIPGNHQKSDANKKAGGEPPARGSSSSDGQTGTGKAVPPKASGSAASHHLLTQARSLLCNMTHRGATGADTRDGDGAGVMTGVPDVLLRSEWKAGRVDKTAIGETLDLPGPGRYAVGNVFFHPGVDDKTGEPISEGQKKVFVEVAGVVGLEVIGWRKVPRNNSILGPAALSREPLVLQPLVVLSPTPPPNATPPPSTAEQAEENEETTLIPSHPKDFPEPYFHRQLYVLRKAATHRVGGLGTGFYVCSLSNRNLVYKGQLTPGQVYDYWYDLNHILYTSHFALVHSRFSTNTFPSWERAQPMRWAAHNGEINSIRGNRNWMRAREGILQSSKFDDELNMLYPIIEPGGSDSAAFDNVLELLVANGVLTLPESVMMMVPEAWQDNAHMEKEKAAWYRWAACLMEPWDGPALFAFSDGRFVGATLDRNGLRPCRWIVTKDGLMVCGSEVGCVYVEPERIARKGRLQPGKMLLVDTVEGHIVDDKELKMRAASNHNYLDWLESQTVRLDLILEKSRMEAPETLSPVLDESTISKDQKVLSFGYTFEQLDLLMVPMVGDGKEALGSMGNDAPLACLATQPRSIYDYFCQLFAQVTNPPIDPIRESIVMSLECYVGFEGNLLDVSPEQCHRLVLPSPLLSIEEMNAVKRIDKVYRDWSTRVIDITFDKREGTAGFESTLSRVCSETTQAIAEDVRVVVLSDRNVGPDRVPLSSLLACGAVHHHLINQKKRSKIALTIETGEVREVHHFCVLLGYGADAICPWLAMEAMLKIRREGLLKVELSEEQLVDNYKHSIDNGILKVMSKMGVSTLQSYKGAQTFEALGLHKEVVDRCFTGTATRIQGATFELLAMDALEYHERGFPSRETIIPPGLPESGEYHWRDGGEAHINDPTGIANLQDAVREQNKKAYETYSKNAQQQVRAVSIRGLLDFDHSKATPIPVEQVEPWHEIAKRFATGGMSYGSISMEAHSSIAVAMNQLGGKSNTGEGGEDAERSIPMPDGRSMRSAIKQVASGRFGVTSNYLADSDELQIKMAQGAKPGEGGELPGHKVSESIGRTRHSTPGVGLISPPPHHDIYSIEDLKQLIYDLKCSSPRGRVSVKLVSEVGVGIVASGVAKAKADHILISGYDGGTGASRWTGIKHAGLPWELGLTETHQTLVLNDLRGRVTVQTDGQLRTGRDVAIACLLGAEEWGFATTPLIALGCIMMRKCHLNTCPVGIATQDPVLRAKFAGQPEHVINFFHYLAEELREVMASLGFRTINEMVGRAEFLKVDESLRTQKTASIDLSSMLKPAWQLRKGVATYKTRGQDHKLYIRLDNKFIDESELALTKGLPVHIDCDVVNTDRALGTSLSHRVSKRYGEEGLPKDTIHICARGSAGQSLGAWLAPGITIELEGDSNDYAGKGLSGGRLIVFPPAAATFQAEENIIIGNVCLYGATSGEAFFRGVAAERFAVRNSGANAVVEGVGDHGCEYMTGGRVVILGTTGRNFAAGMSGGIAYVLDIARDFEAKVNKEMVELGPVTDPHEIAELRAMIEDHKHWTGSHLADRVLHDFNHLISSFIRVMPLDYKAVLEANAAKTAQEKQKKLMPQLNGFDGKTDAIGPQEDLPKNKANGPQEIPPAQPGHHQTPVMDLEDSMADGAAAIKHKEKLDKTRGFMKYKRLGEAYRNPRKRTKDWAELSSRLTEPELKLQAARCMDCGVPFCQSDTGCPVSNVIPKWNDLVFNDRWREALDRLLLTNNFPEFTGRICPAPCEGACVLGINEQPVGIKSIECAIIDRGFEEGWMAPNPPKIRTGKRVAIVGSGPSGLAAADQLNKAGHLVTVYDRNDRAGGLLMYGIPNMKLDKGVVDRRLNLMKDEGVQFVLNAHVGVNTEVDPIIRENDAVIMATGATWPRDLKVANRNLDGIHFAMEFLQLNTSSLLNSNLNDGKYLSAKDKDVIVIGGGDTGNDCIGTSVRHGAKSVTNFELLPQPSGGRANNNPWPQWPRIFRVDYGHSEVSSHFGNDPREFCISTKEFVSDGNGNVKGLNTIRVEWNQDSTGQFRMKEVPGSEQFFPCDLCLLSLGFLGPEEAAVKSLNLEQDPRSNIKTSAGKYATSVPGIFAAGDCRRGQSLVVWGIREGRDAATEVDGYLMHDSSRLPIGSGIKRREFAKLSGLGGKTGRQPMVQELPV